MSQQRHIIANPRRFIAGGTEGKGTGKLGDDLIPSRLDVFEFEDVLLERWQGKERLLAIAHRALPIRAAQHVASDAVHLQHHSDGLLGVVGGIAHSAALGVSGEGVFELIGETEVIDDEAAGFVPKDAVHAGDGLHEAVAFD